MSGARPHPAGIQDDDGGVTTLAPPQALDRVRERLRASAQECGGPIAAAVAPLLGAGKLVRPRCVLALAGEAPSALAAAEAVELIHVASLIHDDLLDGAALRRGVPTIAAAQGPAMARAAGDALFAQAFVVMARSGMVEGTQTLAAVVRDLVAGEWQQTHARGRLDVTEEEYDAYARGKTGVLIGGALALGALCAGDGRTAAWRRAGEDIGVAFQIDDDCLDVEGDARLTGKPRGRDCANGIMTLPVIYALRDNPAWESEFMRARGDASAAEEVCRALVGMSALIRARHASRARLARASAAIDALAAPAQRTALTAVVASLEGRHA